MVLRTVYRYQGGSINPEEIEDHITEVSNIRSAILGGRTLSNLCLEELVVSKGVGYSEKVISNNDRIE